MDAFKVHRNLIDDYRKFTEGFVDIRDERIKASVERQAAAGQQWPDPWLSLNPSFETGGSVDSLVAEGVLHPATAGIFRTGKNTAAGQPIVFHKHQADAIRAALTGASYVLTTGTGSGKSLAYIVPIVDHVLRRGSGKGVQAIVVYPMNALANSQVEELRKFLVAGFGPGNEPVTFRRYTGQESEDERLEILANPPDILLTNYVMLDYVLVRPREREKLVTAAQGLKFLVLDELHTYRGRQGADVSMLVRRVRQATGSGEGLQCVGTSATMSTVRTQAEQRREVAGVASRIFGATVAPENVMTESLVRATTDRNPSPFSLAAAVDARGEAESVDPVLTGGYGALRTDPLASWIEDTFGLTTEPGSEILVRSEPQTVQRAGKRLAELTGRHPANCETAIRATLLAGSRTSDDVAGRPLFAFRLHQFISKGASVYVTAEPEDIRPIEHEYQIVVRGPERRLYPLAFCRECGQEYLMVRRDQKSLQFVARTQIAIGSGNDEGYLFVDSKDPWPANPIERLPQSWVEASPSGPKVIPSRKQHVPQAVVVGPMGEYSAPGDLAPLTGVSAAWIPGSLLFCLRCGVTYENARLGELSKVVTLDQEGRSSAMTVLSTSIIRSLAEEKELPDEVRKLLTFVDNRQDASLQAGHVNDFALVAQLRSAIYAAAQQLPDEGVNPLDFEAVLPKLLNLDKRHYAQSPGAFDTSQADAALRKVVALRAMQDLRRGWRFTLPNLEQTGLIRVRYPIAKALCASEQHWADAHPLLQADEPGQRYELVEVLLDEFRRILAIDTDVFTQEHIDRLRTLSREHLTGVWTVGDTEQVPYLGTVVLAAQPQGGPRNLLALTAKGAYGRWLARTIDPAHRADQATTNDVLDSLVKLLATNGVLADVRDGQVHGYRLKAHQIRLFPGDGTSGAPDPLRRTLDKENAPRVLPYFRDLYREAGTQLAGVVAREHTAQVPPEIRQERETQFGTGELKLLYCSPTMELGIDIRSLDAVAMRNVPPTPANYAQRSGRAGRSGQPAIVVTYCSSGNAHDSYYFARSDQMVAGRVLPPRLDLANEDLIKSHVHAVWLACTPVDLRQSMKHVVEIDQPGYPVNADIAAAFAVPDLRTRAAAAAHAVLGPLRDDLERTQWWSPTWVDEVVANAPKAFDQACDRWRTLDKTVRAEMDAAYQQASDASLPKKERQQAEDRQREARRQRDLLLNESDSSVSQGDYYPYRYFGSEGFLPGYSFPRLPLAAYVPGQRGAGSTWLQRPRFLALREFGPNALVYHEGARYQVVRVNLPRSDETSEGGTPNAGNVTLSEARICVHCNYHHDRQVGTDVCENCGAQLAEPTRNLLAMQTVITRRRDRISADEEERQRLGFDLVTSYRFQPKGRSSGSLRALAVEGGVPLLDVRYGDAAELRVTNTGPKRRAPGTMPGFWIDTVKGAWLSDARAATIDGPDGEDDSPVAADVKRKARVIPYVEDRRNIAVLRWEDQRDESEAKTLMYAVERGIEAVFQLEDSELTSETLADDAHRGRFLLVEAAEGGAGVLRRLHDEADALSRVAQEALRIMHVAPETGADDDDACVRGCYRCLLSYSNQSDHEAIDRRTAVPTLLRLARSTTFPETPDEAQPSPGVPSAPTPTAQAPTPLSGRAAELVRLLGLRGLALPDGVDVVVEGVIVDLAFPRTHAVVIVEDSAHPRLDEWPLLAANWQVIHVRHGDDLEALVAANPSAFGRMG